MEEHIDKIIYIVALIAMSLIPALRKRKKSANPPPVKTDSNIEDKSQIDALLDRLNTFAGNESHVPQPAPVPEQAKYTDIVDLNTESEIINNSESINKEPSTDQLIPINVVSETLSENSTSLDIDMSHEELRKAIIYSEIINRKY